MREAYFRIMGIALFVSAVLGINYAMAVLGNPQSIWLLQLLGLLP